MNKLHGRAIHDSGKWLSKLGNSEKYKAKQKLGSDSKQDSATRQKRKPFTTRCKTDTKLSKQRRNKSTQQLATRLKQRKLWTQHKLNNTTRWRLDRKPNIKAKPTLDSVTQHLGGDSDDNRTRPSTLIKENGAAKSGHTDSAYQKTKTRRSST